MKPDAYQFFECLVSEGRDEGLLAVEPSGGPDDETEIVRWSSPAARRVVRWIAVTLGGPPEAPAAQSLSGGYVLLESFIEAAMPLPTFGNTLWKMQGCYIYALRRPRGVDGDFPLGRMPDPIDKLGGVTIQSVPASQFLRNLLNNTPTASWSPPRLDLPNIIQG